MMSFPVNTISSNSELIYVYPGTIDAISLAEIQDGDSIVVVRNSLKKIYNLNTYNIVLSVMINDYGLDINEAIDPDVPLCNSAIHIDNIKYYIAKLITHNTIISNNSLIVDE